ncbi:MAG: CUB domain-containing protein [Bacteroidia bacterium]
MKKNLLLFIAVFFAAFLSAQTTYIMNNTAVTLPCPSTSLFYDSGGNSSPYSANENYLKTFTAPAGQCIQVTFQNIDIEACCDILDVYDGPTGTSPLLGSLFGTSAGPVTYVSSGNSLTFGFASDFSVQGAGWQATITCMAPCSGAPAPGVASASTVFCAGSGTVTLNTTGGTVACGITYQWQSATSPTGPWTNISGGTTNPFSTTYSSTTYYRMRTQCNSASSVFTNTLTVTTATTAIPCALSNYVASAITYSFDTFVGTVCPSTDDVLYTNIAMMGFPFCFTGAQYWGGYIASNGACVFEAVPCYPNVYFSQPAAPGISTGWSITAPAPSLVSGSSTTPQNAILGPWQDIDPSVAGGTIRYGTLGTAPNRRFVVSFETVPMFNCNAKNFTGQIKLYETTHDIEIHVGHKVVCGSWNNGEAILGLESYDGTIYKGPVNATMHNATGTSPGNQWTMTNTAYRFSAPCASSGPCLVLPVNFKTFYGERKDRINHLYWETAQEENLKSFSVERSADAINFMEIAKVTPHNAASKYQYDDISTAPGTLNYYRITSVDNDGSTKSTNVIVLGANEGEIAVSGIYPNPVKTDFTMSVDSKMITTLTVVIYDAFGKALKTFTQDVTVGVSKLNLYCGDVPAGIYILETTNANKEVVAKQKLVKVN